MLNIFLPLLFMLEMYLVNVLLSTPLPKPFKKERNWLDLPSSLFETERVYRSTEMLTIEVAIFIDSHLEHHWKKKYREETRKHIEKYIFTVLENTKILFNDESMNYNFDMKVIHILPFNSEKFNETTDCNSPIYLRDFCDYQENIKMESNQEWDHAILFTGLNLHENNKNSTLGLSYLNGMCKNHFSCSIIEGFNFVTIYTLTHELGHSLGMQHDLEKCNSLADSIMGTSLKLSATRWSNCSKIFFNYYFRTKSSNCVFSTQYKTTLHLDDYLPGERYSATQQCKITFGLDYFMTHYNKDICKNLYCSNHHKNLGVLRLLEGTSCGIKKICWKGECVEKSSHIV